MEMELAVYLPKTLLCDSIYQLVVTAQHQQSGGQSHGDAQRVRTDRYPVLQVETHVICHDLNDQISKETVHSGVSSDRWFCQTWKKNVKCQSMLRLEYQIRNYEIRTQPSRYIWSLDFNL